MTYVKNRLNWPDPGCQMMDMTQNYSLFCINVIFQENLKTIKADEYAKKIVKGHLFYQI